MKTNTILETWGFIIKEEKIRVLHSSILEGTLVLENYEPFPGYFGENLPLGNLPRSIFIVTAEKYPKEKLARILKTVSQKMKHSCYGSFGSIQYNADTYHCIRVKNLDCFERIYMIQKYLREEGVRMHKAKEINGKAIIKIYKTFLLRQIDENIFKDDFEVNRIYFNYPYFVSWEDFSDITKHVKYNMANNLFDAALGGIWRVQGLSEIIRIYDRNRNSIRMSMMYELYLRETKIWMQENYREPVADISGNRYYVG